MARPFFATLVAPLPTATDEATPACCRASRLVCEIDHTSVVSPPADSPPISIHELAIFRHRLTVSARLIASGRHAPGERKLRQAVGGSIETQRLVVCG